MGKRGPGSPPLQQRLLSKYLFGDDCWEWTATRSNIGYGQIWVEDRMRPAHRVMYEMFAGPIPDGMELDHLCRNRGCGRWDHLEPVTHAENVRRGNVSWWNKAKTACPQGHPYDEKRRCPLCLKAADQRFKEKKKRDAAS